MDVTITELDSAYMIDINGTAINDVVDYKLSTTAHGSTEISLTFEKHFNVKSISLSAN